MKSMQKMGGIAALYAAAAYLIGFLGYGLIVEYGSVVDPVQKVAQLAENQTILYILSLVVYVVWALFLIVLALALYDRLKAGSPAVMQTATALALIWAGLVVASGMVFNIGMERVVDLYGQDPAQAASVWLSIDAVFEGLGGGNEIVGGLWVVLVSWAALRAGGLPRVLNYLGLVIGLAGICSTVPALGEIGGMIFGLGQIVWFVWLGIVLLRGTPTAEA